MMEINENKCFGIVVKSCFNTPRAIKLFKQKNVLYLITWNKCKMTIFESTTNFDSQVGSYVPNDMKENSSHWELALDHNIIDVLQKNETIFVVEATGSLYQLDASQDLDMETNQLTEVDMFGGSPSPIVSDRVDWKLNKTGKFEDCDTVLAVCSVEHGFAALAIKRGHLFLLVYKLLKFFPSVVVQIVTHNKQETIRGGVISSFLPKTLSPELRSGLLKGLESDDREILLIGLSNGEIMWIPVNSTNRGPHILYYAVQPIQNFHWISVASDWALVKLDACAVSSEDVSSTISGKLRLMKHAPSFTKTQSLAAGSVTVSHLISVLQETLRQH